MQAYEIPFQTRPGSGTDRSKKLTYSHAFILQGVDLSLAGAADLRRVFLEVILVMDEAHLLANISR
jgi:hypothetical protein